jgi:hemolysin-activating ACP:hemolysin acyltransferase
MKTLAETDQFVFAQEDDEIRALGLMVMLGSLAELYGQEPLFLFADRVRQHIDAKKYGILYQKIKTEKVEGLAPVAFVTWADLSAPCAVMFEKRFRPLFAPELSSGTQPWLMDLCAPTGHGVVTKEFYEHIHPDVKEYFATRERNGRWRKETFKVKV